MSTKQINITGRNKSKGSRSKGRVQIRVKGDKIKEEDKTERRQKTRPRKRRPEQMRKRRRTQHRSYKGSKDSREKVRMQEGKQGG